ncbi:MAG TPA: RIP metalloprotease RseP, partial [Nevskiaceae bacterium]|nr:RIP metalloprotease RseP [Nevskiaceae bacterium]
MLDFLWSAGAFVLAIGVLVSIHEFGHYWVGRRLGVKVLRFSLGFGKPFYRRYSRDGVEWAIAAIPLGGYVKFLDEREGPVPPSMLHLSFNRQPPWKRILIVAAGPLFNFLLAILFYWCVLVLGVTDRKPLLAAPEAGSVAAQAGLQSEDEVIQIGDMPVRNWTTLRMEIVDEALNAKTMHLLVRSKAAASARSVDLPLEHVRRDPEFLFDDLGLEPYNPPVPPVLKDVLEGGSAAIAGFQPGDRLVAYNDHPIESFQDWRTWVLAHPGEVAKVKIQRGGAELSLQVIIAKETQGGKTFGRFGATAVDPPAELWNNLRAEYRLDPLPALPASARQTWQMSELTLKLLYRMVLGDVSIKNVSGPIQIAQYAGYS